MIRKSKILFMIYTGRYSFEGLPIECFKVQYTNMPVSEYLLELICMN